MKRQYRLWTCPLCSRRIKDTWGNPARHRSACLAALKAKRRNRRLRKGSDDVNRKVEAVMTVLESSLLLARQEIETLKGEAGREYWRGFAQAKYNRPGTLSTAEDLIRTARELAELKAEHERVTAERDRAERQLVILMGQLEAAESQLQILRAQHQQLIEQWRESAAHGDVCPINEFYDGPDAMRACADALAALHPRREEKQA